MSPIPSAFVAARFAAALSGAAYLLLRFRYPAFFSGGLSECLGVLGSVVGSASAVALLGGFVLPRQSGRIAAALVAAPLAAGFAILDLPSPAPIGVAAIALVAATGACFLARMKRLEGRGASIASLAVAVLACASSVLGPAPARTAPTEGPHVFVFGLDAGTWTILDEQFARDALPNLRRLKEEGVSGILGSEVESASPRVWTTLASGKRPEKHGVVGFFSTQNRDLRVRRIWEILQAKGLSVGLFQWLVTWPPDPFDPFVVPGWMARGAETYPESLSFVKELEQSFQTGEFQDWLDHGETARAFRSLRDWGRGYLAHGLRFSTALRIARLASTAATDSRWEIAYAAKRTIQLLLNGDLFLDLYRSGQPDFSSFICYGTDNLAHKLWQYHFPDDFGIPHETAEPFKDLLVDYYRETDRLLGEILPLLPPETIVAVVSDHGFTSRGEGGEASQHEHRPRMEALARLMGLDESAVVASSIATRGYYRPVAAGEEARRAVVDRVFGFLRGCTRLDGKTPVFKLDVTGSGELEVAMNLDSEFERSTPVLTPEGEMLYGDLADIEDRSGNHSVEGILILRGPGVRRGATVEGARLEDFAPTILHLLGLPVGADMDGGVLEEALSEEFRDAHEIERIASWDVEVPLVRESVEDGDDTAMLEYARQIGYVGEAEEEPRKGRRPER